MVSISSFNNLVDSFSKNGYKIKYFRHEKNMGMHANGLFALSKVTGKYIAACEGDDYWTDPLKLQKQVDFLENNEEYGLTHHDADYFFQKTKKWVKNHHRTNKINVSDGFVFNQLLINNNIYTPTVLFRTKLLVFFFLIDKEIRDNSLMVDYVMWLEFSQRCKFYYINESMATYRVLENSASKSTDYSKTLQFNNSYYNIKHFFLNKYSSSLLNYNKINQVRMISNVIIAINHKKNTEAKGFAAKISIDDSKSLLVCVLVFFPLIFRLVLKMKAELKNK
jgi:glycosyltransferase involved in cell wall biosynthesis